MFWNAGSLVNFHLDLLLGLNKGGLELDGLGLSLSRPFEVNILNFSLKIIDLSFEFPIMF